ncbi:glycerophosphodiester phosphodiesterase family protein [Candidatus Methanocrinis natronophilus]|uniref:Glycerophosphodiester phosphodiesterase family protein n=1 Tax=Candidatus Methanocrinis natronophilus TaxID=3033396 RepID=A0ABT5X662_9EURY|nr:glycerophosphodiester phosphodiesterase family protein [Candidatus Methanocrinis natronophilus]MDF0590184.1 glycerophosphodiester phosphodiesterase family protein [Candidatus Methanocrinis natronophilus]
MMSIIIGHRGARSEAPENTLESIRAARRCGADFVEVDVRLSKDGYLVVIHDETVDRTTDGTGRVGEMALEDIRLLDAGQGEKVPTLAEAAALAGELDLGIVVEMKEEGLEDLVAGEVRGRRAIVTSFYHNAVREIKELGEIKTGIIISSLPVKPVELALEAEADSIFPRLTNPNLFKAAHREEIEVYPWTINDPDEVRWLKRLGADGIVTDDPCRVRKAADEPVTNVEAEECQYYPCHHFEGQDCTHCFCPLYPCRDPQLGRFIKAKRGKRLWSCVDCTLVHRPKVARYLRDHPSATVEELKRADRMGDL